MNSHSTPIYIVHYESNHTTTGQNFTHGTCMPGYADTWISVLYVTIIISSRGEVRERPLQRAHTCMGSRMDTTHALFTVYNIPRGPKPQFLQN